MSSSSDSIRAPTGDDPSNQARRRRRRRRRRRPASTISIRNSPPSSRSIEGDEACYYPLGIQLESQCSPLTYHQIHPVEKIKQLNRSHGGWIEASSHSSTRTPPDGHPAHITPSANNKDPFLPSQPSNSLDLEKPQDLTLGIEPEHPNETIHRPIDSRRTDTAPVEDRSGSVGENSSEIGHHLFLNHHLSQPQLQLGHFENPIESFESILPPTQNCYRSDSCLLFYDQTQHTSDQQHLQGISKDEHHLIPQHHSIPLESLLPPTQDLNRSDSCQLFYDDEYSNHHSVFNPHHQVVLAQTSTKRDHRSTPIDRHSQAHPSSSSPTRLPTDHQDITVASPSAKRRRLPSAPDDTLRSSRATGELEESIDRSPPPAVFVGTAERPSIILADDSQEDPIQSCSSSSSSSQSFRSPATMTDRRSKVLVEDSQELVTRLTPTASLGRRRRRLQQQQQHGPRFRSRRSLAPPTPISVRFDRRRQDPQRSLYPRSRESSSRVIDPNHLNQTFSDDSPSSILPPTQPKLCRTFQSHAETINRSPQRKVSESTTAARFRQAWTTDPEFKIPKERPRYRQIGIQAFLTRDDGPSTTISPSERALQAGDDATKSLITPTCIRSNQLTDLVAKFSRRPPIHPGCSSLELDASSKRTQDREGAADDRDEEEEETIENETWASSPSASSPNLARQETVIPDSQASSPSFATEPIEQLPLFDQDHDLAHEPVDREMVKGDAQKIWSGFRERISRVRQRLSIYESYHAPSDRKDLVSEGGVLVLDPPPTDQVQKMQGRRGAPKVMDDHPREVWDHDGKSVGWEPDGRQLPIDDPTITVQDENDHQSRVDDEPGDSISTPKLAGLTVCLLHLLRTEL